MNHRKKRRLGRRQAAGLSAAIVATVVIAGFTANWVWQATVSSGPTTPSGFGSSSPGGHQVPASHSPDGGGSPAATNSPSAGGGSPDAGAGSAAGLIPASGAYLGAYVEPAAYTPAAKIAAVRSFQRTVGGPIDLVHTYHPWFSAFPDAADRYFVRSGKVLLLTWSGTPDTRKIIAGNYDALIRARAEAVKRLGRPILMQFRHEMDRPNVQWAVHGPKNYIAAWDHIRAIFTEVGATNVGWVWCPTGWGFGDGRAEPFYPGNNEVDWVCADVYSITIRQPLQESAQPFLKWAKTTRKPVLIGEFAVNGTPSAWPTWLLAAGELARVDRQIKGMAYFDANGADSQGRPFQYWLGANEPALRTFHQMLHWGIFRPVLPGAR